MMLTNIALKNPSITQGIYNLIATIAPYDDIESGSPIFRIQKPDVPNKHLVSYFVLFDEHNRKILLVDHKKALLWLPSGGHVEIDEEFMRQRIKDLINSKTNIPRPETWCAYHITIQDIEFWLGSQDRFHHRVQYKLNHDVWHHQKLQP